MLLANPPLGLIHRLRGVARCLKVEYNMLHDFLTKFHTFLGTLLFVLEQFFEAPVM